MIRGFSTNRLLYSVDGVRMNTAIFRSGNLQNVISLDPFALENTEIFFGPGSIIYGSDAIGAVMSFQTLEAELVKANEKKNTGKRHT
jgi:hemoglobin/transferrin/lactoferrin receptor protein